MLAARCCKSVGKGRPWLTLSDLAGALQGGALNSNRSLKIVLSSNLTNKFGSANNIE